MRSEEWEVRSENGQRYMQPQWGVGRRSGAWGTTFRGMGGLLRCVGRLLCYAEGSDAGSPSGAQVLSTTALDSFGTAVGDTKKAGVEVGKPAFLGRNRGS